MNEIINLKKKKLKIIESLIEAHEAHEEKLEVIDTLIFESEALTEFKYTEEVRIIH